eukprot:2872915-Rhodomonas_salina.2
MCTNVADLILTLRTSKHGPPQSRREEFLAEVSRRKGGRVKVTRRGRGRAHAACQDPERRFLSGTSLCDFLFSRIFLLILVLPLTHSLVFCSFAAGDPDSRACGQPGS